MKTKKSNAFTIIKVMVVFAIVGISGFALAATAGVRADSRYPKDNSLVRDDAARIKADKENLKSYRHKMKQDRKANEKLTVIIDRKDVRKAKADVRKDRAYFYADKRDFKADHNLAIKEKRKTLRDDRADVRKTKRHLYWDMVRGKDEAVAKDANQLVADKKQARESKTSLANRRSEKKSEVVAMNKDVRKTLGAPVFVKGVENVFASVTGEKQ